MRVKQTIAGLREFSMRRRQCQCAKTGLVLCPALGLALLQLSAAEPENSNPENNQDRETLTFEVSGTVDYKFLTQTLPPSKRYYQKIFSLSVSNCNWQIKVQDLDLFNIQSAQDIIFGCEDSYLYEVAHFHSGATNAVVAVAEKMPVPRPGNSLASIIWLAFCSGGYFDQRTNNMAHPVWFVDSRARNGLFQADADLHEDAARLPRSVIWRVNRRYHVPLEWNAPMEEQPLPGPLRGKEYVAAKYQVLETLPLGEIHLPKEASFLRYSPTHSGTNTRPIYEVVVKVEKATPTLSLASMIPTMPEGTVYSERRFTSEGQRNWFSIISTNGHFPPVEGLASLGEKMNQTAINVPGHRRRVWLGRILILLVILSCPLSIWYFRKITPNLENNGQNKAISNHSMKAKHQKIPLGMFLVFTLASAPVANETVCTERINPIFGRSDNCSGQWIIRHGQDPEWIGNPCVFTVSYNGTECVDAGFVTGTRKLKDQPAAGYRFQKWGTSQAVGMRDCKCGEIELEEMVYFNTTECVLTEEDCPPNPYE